MPKCRMCEEEQETEDFVSVRSGSRTVRVCSDCADQLEEEANIAQESESAVQRMMEFSGRR